MINKILNIPTLNGIKNAKNRIGKYLSRTPLIRSIPLSKEIDADIYIKYENHHPTSAFKVRGGINFVSQLLASNTYNGETLLAGSTGNHGQSIAYAGMIFSIPVMIVCPEGSNPDKVQAIRDFGASIVFHGKDVFESWEHCEELQKDKQYIYVHSVETPDLFEGVGTIGLEVYEDLPDVDCFITGVGGGSGLCGSSIALKSLDSKIKTYGVQSSGAPAVYDSFKQKKLVTYPHLNTFAEGLATRSAFPYALNILEQYVDDVFLVSDKEIKESILLLLQHTHNIAEGAGASSLAGLIKNKEMFKGKKVVCVLTGGNLQIETLKGILANSH